MKKILLISPYYIFKDASHAGGQIVNFYFENISNTKDDFLTGYIIGDIDDKQSKKMKDCFKDSIDFTEIPNFLKKINEKLTTKLGMSRNIFLLIINIYVILKFSLRDKKLVNWSPNVIIMEWFQVLIFAKLVKKSFPNSKIIVTEHDIFFQTINRRLTKSPSLLKIFWKVLLILIKKLEINALNNADLVNVLTIKDKQLILNNSSIKDNKVNILTPFYQQFTKLNAEKDGILFFGAMNRIENRMAVDWFITKCWQQIDQKHNLKFYVVGGGLNNKFTDKYSTFKNVIFTGYVSDPSEIMSKCYFSIVPLQLGGGIKLKVLESFAVGLPVITNDIGIEGLDDYLYCPYLFANTPDDYIKIINNFNIDDLDKLSKQAISFVNHHFNYIDNVPRYLKLLKNLK